MTKEVVYLPPPSPPFSLLTLSPLPAFFPFPVRPDTSPVAPERLVRVSTTFAVDECQRRRGNITEA